MVRLLHQDISLQLSLLPGGYCCTFHHVNVRVFWWRILGLQLYMLAMRWAIRTCTYIHDDSLITPLNVMSFCRIYQVVECRIMVFASSLQTQKVRVKFWNIVCGKSLNTIKSYKLFFCYAVKNKKMKRWKLIFTFIKHNKECFKLLTLKP